MLECRDSFSKVLRSACSDVGAFGGLSKRRDLDSFSLSFQRIIDLLKLATYGDFFDDQNRPFANSGILGPGKQSTPCLFQFPAPLLRPAPYEDLVLKHLCVRVFQNPQITSRRNETYVYPGSRTLTMGQCSPIAEVLAAVQLQGLVAAQGFSAADLGLQGC
jgi:hypothetical protein